MNLALVSHYFPYHKTYSFSKIQYSSHRSIMATNSFALSFAIILVSTVCLANGQDSGSIKILNNDQVIKKYKSKLPNGEEEFTCQITGWSEYRKTIVKWYLEDELIDTAQYGNYSKFDFKDKGTPLIDVTLKYKLEEDHYTKKLKCKATYQDSTLEAEVKLLMKSKF